METKDVYLISWWIPAEAERYSGFYAVEEGTSKDKLDAFASVATWFDKWRGRTLLDAVRDFEEECYNKFGLIRLNIKPTHDEYKPIKHTIEHYRGFIDPEYIIDVKVGPAPMND